jgi:ABC-type glycerol-3-phosphate transport system permease component
MRTMTPFERVLTYVLLIIGAVIVMVPFWWLVMTAVSPKGTVSMGEFRLWPQAFAFGNFREALTHPEYPFGRFFVNTVTVTLSRVIGCTFSAALVAYAFARLRFRGSGWLFVLVLATMMVPYQVMMIPRFLLFRELGWIDTLLPLFVPAFFGGGAFNIFLLRQFFRTIPQATLDAARIDGCGYFATFWHVVLPMSKPALATVAIFTFMGTWNDYLAPLVYLNTKDNYTLSLGLALFRTRAEVVDITLLMTASLVVLLPCIIVFFICQRLFIQGVVVTGVK